MDAAQQTIPLEPGKDSSRSTQPLYKGIADNLSQVFGIKVEPGVVIPERQKRLVTEGLENVIEETGHAIDLEDIIAGESGKPRTEKARNFLRIFLGRLRKKHPDENIYLEEKG